MVIKIKNIEKPEAIFLSCCKISNTYLGTPATSGKLKFKNSLPLNLEFLNQAQLSSKIGHKNKQTDEQRILFNACNGMNWIDKTETKILFKSYLRKMRIQR